MKMKAKFVLLIGFLFVVLCVNAQKSHGKFSPEKFDQELRQYIIKEACLSQEEADKFFLVYKEMRQKQRVFFIKQRNSAKQKPSSEEGCRKAIQERDNLELEQKRLQQAYHNRFLEILPASKVYDILRAEDRFHRHKLKQWGEGDGKTQNKHD